MDKTTKAVISILTHYSSRHSKNITNGVISGPILYSQGRIRLTVTYFINRSVKY